MAIKEIEQNTDYLGDDISRLEGEQRRLEQAVDQMFSAVRELSDTWEGPAKAAFTSQFDNDYNRCKELNKSLAALLDKLRTARSEYDKCEDEVGGVVRSIRV